MKKKSLLIVAILTFVLSFAFAACGETTPDPEPTPTPAPHTHEYVTYTWVEGSVPSETADGKATAKCTGCDETTTVDVAKLTDDSVWTMTATAATCTEDGKKVYTSKYGTVEVTIPAEHTFGDLVAATDSTCLKKGNVAYYHCTVCEKNFAEDKTTELESVEKALADHVYGTLIEATTSTCVEHGTVEHYHCSVCGKDFDADKNVLDTIEAPLAAHTFGDLVAAVASTCQTHGNVAYYHCSVCEKNFAEDKTTVLETVEAPLGAHNYGEWQKGDENGHFRACTTEGCTEKETVAHDYTGQAYYPAGTEEHYVNCKVCNYEHREHHEFGEWTKKDETNHAHKCAKCNKEITEAHTGGTATCKAQAVCTVCHEGYGDLADHVLGADGKCTVCGKTPNAVFGKTYSAFTVNASGTVDTSVNALLTFDANGKAVGVTGSVGIIKKNGEYEDEGWDDTEYYKITDSSVYIRYVDKEKGTIQFVSSYYKATKYSSYGKYGTPTLTETKYPGYITATNGFIFIPQGYGTSIVLVPTDTAVTTADVVASAFNTSGKMYGKIFFKYTGTEAHSVYYDASKSPVVVAIDATITDFDDNTVEVASIKTAKAMVVKDKDGNVLAKYGYDSTQVVELDDWAGKYAGTAGTVTVWGTGKITTPYGEGDYVEVADKDYNIEVTYVNEDGDVIHYIEVKANKENKTYESSEPSIDVTYDLGDYGTTYTDTKGKKVTFTLPAAPTPNNEAYMFSGWSIGGDVYEPGAKVAFEANTTVTAIWQMKVKITVVDAKNAANNKYFYAGADENLLEAIAKNTTTVLDGEEFKYWTIEVDGEPTEVGSDWTVGGDALTVTAVWKVKYTLTLVYGNGLANATETYFEGAATNPKEPPYTGGKNFDHWYTSDDNGATETARYATGTAITADTTIYAAWVDANILYGKYLGFEVYGKTYDSPYLTNGKSAEIDVNGKATSGSRISGSTVSDYSNGFFKFGNYYGYYDEVSKILVYNDSTGTDAQHDVHILFKGATSVVTEKAKYFIITDGGTQKLIDVTVTVDGVESSFTIYFHDKKVEKVTWTADEGMTNVSDLFSVKTNSWSAGSIKTNVLKIYDLSGNLIGDFMKNGSKMVELDGSQGTYTLDGGENLVLTGTGAASIGTDEGTVTKAADGSSYTYDLYITQGGENVYYELTIDKEAKTYSLNKPMVTLSFDLDGKGTMASVSINKNIEYALTSPTYDGYKFEGWYTGKTVGDDGNVTYTGSVTKVTPTENTTVYAKWAKAITVTFETEHGEAPKSEVFKQGEYIGMYYFVTLADTEDYAFYGWYVKGDETKTVIKSSYQLTGENDVTFVALWKQKVTLTVVYKDAKATIAPVKVGPGKTIDFTEIKGKQYTEAGQLYVVDKLYSDNAYTAEFTATSIDVDTTLYATWKTAHALYGEYKGANYDPNDSRDADYSKPLNSNGASIISSNFSIDSNGVVLSGSTRVPVGNNTVLNSDGTLSFAGSSTYNGGYDAKHGIFFFDYRAAQTEPYHDIYVFFKTVGNVTVSSSVGSAWNKGCTELFTATYSNGSTLNVFIYNRHIYGGVTFVAKDASGNEVTDVSKVYNADTVYVLNDAGEWIAGFKKTNGSFAADETVRPE